MATVQTPIAEGDHVEFYTSSSYPWPATGTVERTWTEDGTQVASVLADPDPFVLSAIPYVIELADLKRIRGAR